MKIQKGKLRDYFVLAARVLIAWTFLSYGWSKLTGGQFGISEEEMATPVKDLSFFRLSWYLFAQEPFKSFIGISQIIAGLLLLYNRTALIGALMALPILANILIIDITYVKMTGFYWRLSYYILLDFFILFHYKERMLTALKSIVNGLTTKFNYPFWAYLILPFAAIGLEIACAIPQLFTNLICNPLESKESFLKILHACALYFNW